VRNLVLEHRVVPCFPWFLPDSCADSGVGSANTCDTPLGSIARVQVQGAAEPLWMTTKRPDRMATVASWEGAVPSTLPSDDDEASSSLERVEGTSGPGLVFVLCVGL
jgi:hypothetical protein